VLADLIPLASYEYVSYEDENEYMASLMEKEDKSHYCYYVTLKIYHFLKTFYSIELKDFITEFLEDEFGNLFLFNAIIIDLAHIPEEAIRTAANIFRIPEQEKRRVEIKEEIETGSLMSENKNRHPSKKKVYRKKESDLKSNSYRDPKIIEDNQKLNRQLEGIHNLRAMGKLNDFAYSKAINNQMMETQRNLIMRKRKIAIIDTNSGTASFLSPDRKKARINTSGGDWMNLEVSKLSLNLNSQEREVFYRPSRYSKLHSFITKASSQYIDRNIGFVTDGMKYERSRGSKTLMLPKANKTSYSFTPKMDPLPRDYLEFIRRKPNWNWNPSKQDFNKQFVNGGDFAKHSKSSKPQIIRGKEKQIGVSMQGKDLPSLLFKQIQNKIIYNK